MAPLSLEKSAKCCTALRLGICSVLLLGLGACRRGHPPDSGQPEGSRAAGLSALHANVQRGISFVHSWEEHGQKGYGSEASRSSLKELRSLGTTWISVMPFGFLPALDADFIRLPGDSRDPGGALLHKAGESDDRVRRQIADAHALGLSVLLKPHLWIGRGAWCGEINPGTPERWARFFASYERFLLHYAELAQSAGADLLTVGVELCSTTAQYADRWRELIAKTRTIYKGKLVYAANWDEVGRVSFWDALDFIGVQFYAPLADTPESPERAMAQRLSKHLDAIEQVARRTQRSVLFTEVGYKSIRGTAVQPHLWPEHLPMGSAIEVSHAAQAQAYKVFFNGIRQRDWVAGVYIWKWFSNLESQEEDATGFSPRGKPTEAVLRAAFGPAVPTSQR